MNPASAKAKGRRFRQAVRDDPREMPAPYGLEDGDTESTSMGVSGVDIIQSPAAKRVLPLCIECKAVEALNVVGIFQKHYAQYAVKDPNGLKLLIHTRNRIQPLVTLRWKDFLDILAANLKSKAAAQ